MSTTRKKAPGKAQPAAALRTRPPSRKSAKPPIATAELTQGEALRPLRIELDPAFKIALDDLKALVERQTTLAATLSTLALPPIAPGGLRAGEPPQPEPAAEVAPRATGIATRTPGPARAYALIWRDDLIALIGPFGTCDEAAEWSQDPKNNPHDDPRWQVLHLSYDATFPRRFTPWHASLAIQAGTL